MHAAPFLRFPNPLPATLAGRCAMLLSLITQTAAILYHRTTRERIGSLLVAYLGRTARRLDRLFAAVAAGTHHPPPPRRSRATGRRAGPPPVALPRQFGWLLRDLRHEVAVWRHQLEAQLATDEAKAFLAAAPSAARLLRPLCDMLALRPPLLYPPKPQPAPPPEPEPTTVPEPEPPKPCIWRIENLPCPRMATRWPWRDLLGKIRP